MITSIELNGIRGIREGKLADFTPLTVFVGRNGCGKSTILDAMFIAANPYGPGAGLGAIVQRHEGVQDGSPWLLWRLGSDPSTRHRVAIKTDQTERTCSISATRTHDGQHFALTCTTTTGPAGSTDVEVESVWFEFENKYRFMQHANKSLVLEGVSDLRLIDVPAKGAAQPLHELYTDAVKFGRRFEATQILGKVVPNLTNVEILTERNVPIVHLVYETHSVPAALAGDGVYSLLRIVLEIASRQGGVVLIEEPETHKHPGALYQTARVIWAAVRRGIQVFITTHSLELIDMLLAESKDDLPKYSLYHLRLDNGRLITSRSDGDSIAFSRGSIQDDLR